MRLEFRKMAEANPQINDTLPKRGRVNEVCREWIVYEDEALAYQLQKQEVEQHYGGNKERNARVREDFPKAKEEQEKEIWEAAEKYRQMVRKQEQIDSSYARSFAERMERDEYERRRRTQLQDMEMAQKMQTMELNRNATVNPLGDGDHHYCRHELKSQVKISPMSIPDVNRVGIPLVQSGNFGPSDKHQSNMTIKSLRLNSKDCLSDCVSPSQSSSSSSPLMLSSPPEIEPSSSQSLPPSTFREHMSPIRISVPATIISEDSKSIMMKDSNLQDHADRKLQEEKDAELARMLQTQEEEIFTEEIDRDRMIAIEAQDKELAKLLYEKEKAKVRRAKERAKQRALLKKRQQQQDELVQNSNTDSNRVNENTSPSSVGTDEFPPPVENLTSSTIIPIQKSCEGEDSCATNSLQELRGFHSDSLYYSSTPTSDRRMASSMMNVAKHIDPTYLSQQSSSTPNSLIFQDGDATAPPYMPIQGQRRNTPLVDKKQKKSKSRDNCKQQ